MLLQHTSEGNKVGIAVAEVMRDLKTIDTDVQECSQPKRHHYEIVPSLSGRTLSTASRSSSK